MLTAEAFNALLKTLEEPPPHVKFIFATTRPYKILPTILSRCQRFDFHMLPMEVIVDSLKNIAAREKININEEALFMIAKNASGSMRDAQVMLDQIASYSSGKITGQAVSGMLGLMDGEMAYRTARAILEHDAGAILDALKQMTAQGKDPSFIASSLIEYFRDIL
jgi:DNA polymerase-3 subunit gamma/tau